MPNRTDQRGKDERPHREALLRWALEDPQGWVQAMATHRRVQAEGVRGVELEDLKEALRSSSY